MKRVALLCPGRGAYTRRTMGTLPADHPWTAAAEELRRELGLPSLLELDRAERFDKEVHLRAENVSPLIYLSTMLDARGAKRAHRVDCAGGNSLGWYTAVAVSGALSFEDGLRLVQTMAVLQAGHAPGGQIVEPIVDEHWRFDPAAIERTDAAIRAAPAGEAFLSIELGGYRVLAGTEAGLAHLLDALPQRMVGDRLFPYRLDGHGPYHTPLQEPVAERARRELADLGWRRPEITLVDGRGDRFTPWTTDPAELRDYTLGRQITTPFRFTRTVRTALREHAPDAIVLPGPGNTLGGVCGQVLVNEGYRGIRSRADFERAQKTDTPPLLSMHR